jgi:hypothetical protein
MPRHQAKDIKQKPGNPPGIFVGAFSSESLPRI